MKDPDDLRDTRIPLNNGSGAIPALGFGTLIPDPVTTKNATKAALEAGFRLLDTAERYQTEREVGAAMQEVFKQGKIKREDVFVVTKLWNTNHRPAAGQTGFRGQSPETPTRLRRSLSDPHPVCIPTRGRARSEGCKRQRDL